MLAHRTRSLSALVALAGFGVAAQADAQTAQLPAVPDGWSYAPLERPAVPAARDSEWVRNPIDAFVLHRLEQNGLRPAAPADKIAWLRRATYDLTGLPPTHTEVEAFLADGATGAVDRVVDRLLASSQYGVKWARHWLDLVRFAETDSYERDRRKPNAWRYRDWVVESLNADKPYDRFLLEQLAGDELDSPTLETVVATGYYRLGIWDDEPTDPKQAVYDDYDSIVDTTARLMLGISMGCARCHDHKRDPIPQRDYYRMLAFFEGIKPYKVGGGNATTQANYVRKVPADLGSSDFDARLADWRQRRTDDLREIRDLATATWERPGYDERSKIAAERDGGLVTHLPFDDASDPGLEVQGRAASVEGRLDLALAFGGGEDGGVIPRPVQDDFTIALWFRADRPGRGRAGDLRWFTGSGLVDGEIRGIVDDFGISLVADHVTAGTGKPETFVHSQGGYADGQWHHVAFTRHRATGRIVLYVDGTEVMAKNGGKQSLSSPEVLRIGRLGPGNGPFRGAIDDVRIYDRVLESRAVLDLAIGGGADARTEAAVEERMGKPEAGRYRSALQRLMTQRQPVREMVEVLCVQENGTAIGPSHVLGRGNVHAQGNVVVAGFPEVLGGGDADAIEPRADGQSSGRRRAFAEWLLRDDNPLTWRVIANRLWQYHFGRGLARNPNDFGRLGEKPTHPQLLDWLATETIARGKSLKSMHRLIMTSAAYRMGSAHDARAARVDPRNDLLWRFDMRRLTAEELRDSILAANGTLNLKMGGPGIYPKMPAAVLATSSRPGAAWGRSSPEEAARRSLYIHVKRSLLSPFLLAFDLADTDTTCPVRFATTQPTQALTMINSEFLHEQAALLAGRLRREAVGVRDQVALGLSIVTQRAADPTDVDEGIELIAQLQQRDGVSAETALDHFALVLLNLNELAYLD